ncbi:hypothetical protein DASC09_062440 [Saccharomycopsis crataegensis]|uniref:Peptidase M20 dimerisation domain-containing protein n=1 Tax=Saccharomycopsis crataegensis TaxID=43959 RepID=A0AAV5QVC2_9ASCO|nr:hypothetical protein DASC09_062440 [Saccharomycopsis crataegensis]
MLFEKLSCLLVFGSSVSAFVLNRPAYQSVLDDHQLIKHSANTDFDTLFETKFPEFYSKYHLNHNLSSIFNLHKTLVDIPSLSTHEQAVTHYVVRFLQKRGLTVETSKLPNSTRENIYAYYNDGVYGNNSHRKILLTSHLDTVPPYLGYNLDESTGVITGRGANDAKASLVVQIYSVLELIEEGKLDPLEFAFLFVVGEEIDGDGMKHAMETFKLDNGELKYSWDVAIFGEPTENKLGKGHKGNYMFDLAINGKPAHSGYPQLGVSANEILVSVLNQLMVNSHKYPSSDILGETTFNIGTMQGGIALNVIPADAHARLFFRVANDLNKLHWIVTEIIDNANANWAMRYPGFTSPFIEVHNLSSKEPQFLDYEVPGFESIVLAFATDIPDFTIPVKRRYLYGPGSIFSAHSDHEFVTIDELIECLEGYKKLVVFNLENL